MPSLLIYLPGRPSAQAADLAAVGLGDLLDAAAVSAFTVDRGPDGGGGSVAYWGDEMPSLDDYTFEPAKGRKEGAPCWLGKPKEGKLGPADLARKKQQLGADVLLADGQAWCVPIARQLPLLLGLDDSGAWTGVVAPQYRAFYEAAWSALEWLAPGADNLRRVDAQAGADFAASALSINYRVNRDVIALLGLLTTELIFEIAEAAVEFAAIVDAQQKKTAEASSAEDSSPAEPASPPSDAGPPG
jgi:hypothetical protein